MPIEFFAIMATAMLGWGGFTWSRAEKALDAAERSSDRTDKLELKLAEKYLTKEEFELQMERLFKTLERLESKLDQTMYLQVPEAHRLRYRSSPQD